MAFASTRARRLLSRASVALVSAAMIGAVFAANGAMAQTKPTANAQIKDASGRVVATADLREGSGEVIIQLSLPNPPVVSGIKGFHIREHGRCDGPDFASAGNIFNPTNRQHGLQNAQGPMVGDLPNVLFSASGLSSYNTSSTGASLSSGPGMLLDADGSALVIMSDIDDGKSQPEGNSGQRIACGVIVAGAAAAAPVPAIGAAQAAVATPTPRATVAPPVVPAAPKPATAPTPTAPAKPVATIPARPTQSATLTAFALSVAKPGGAAGAAAPGAPTPTPAAGAALAKPSIVIPVTSAQQPLTAAQQPQTQPTNSGGGPPPAFLIAALGIILLGAGYAVGRFRTKS